MIDAGARAARRVALLVAESPHAARLARYASLAVRIDAPLLRRLRLRMLPGVDATAEADLWFSRLPESRGDDGFVLDGDVAQQLRQELAAERTPRGEPALDQAYGLMADMHRHWPASLRLEEELAFVALANKGNVAAAVERLLRPAVKAMAEGDARAAEVARWVLRALPRLPLQVREADIAVTLTVAAIACIGGSAGALSSGHARGLPPDLRWLLPPGSLTQHTELVCDVAADSLRFRAPRAYDKSALRLTVPRTRPIVLELAWQKDGVADARTIAVRPDALVPLPAGWRDLTIRTLAGDGYLIETVASITNSDIAARMRGACVDIVTGDYVTGLGVFVQRDLVLTLSRLVANGTTTGNAPQGASTNIGNFAARGPQNAQTISVEYAGQRFDAKITCHDIGYNSGLVLLALNRVPEGAIVLPRRALANAVGPSIVARTFNRVPGGRDVVAVTTGAAAPHALEAESSDAPASWYRIVSSPDTMLPSYFPGAPVLINGAIAGLINETAKEDTGYQSSADVVANDTVERFLRWALRPAEHEPDIYFAYSPEDSYGKGIEMDEAAVAKVEAAASAARLRLWRGNDKLVPGTNWEDATVRPLRAAQGAVLLATPVTPRMSEWARREMLALAFRVWAMPSFPQVTLTFRTDRLHLPRPLQERQYLNVDKMTDATLARFFRHALDGDSAPHNTQADPQLINADVETLVQQIAPGATNVAASLTTLFLQHNSNIAQSMLAQWVRHASPTNQQRLVDLALMLALPTDDFVEPLRNAVHADSDSRALCLNAMPLRFARWLITKAWYPVPPPAMIDMRDQSWPGPGEVEGLVRQVRNVVADALDCHDKDAAWLLEHTIAPYYVLFATRPLPDTVTVDNLKRRLPSAVLLFLTGQPHVPVERARSVGIVSLPPLPDGLDLRLIANYKSLLNLAEPRDRRSAAGKSRSPDAAPRSAAGRNPATPTAAKPKAAKPILKKPKITKRTAATPKAAEAKTAIPRVAGPVTKKRPIRRMRAK